MSTNLSVSGWVIIALIGYFVFRRFSARPRLLPPGPKPFPIVGNIVDLPPDGIPEFKHWLKHKDLYGPISSVTILGMTLVILHDKKAAHDILEQNATKTSARPSTVFANEMCGYGGLVISQGYDNTFRHYRKLLHREFGTKVLAARFRDMQEIEVKRQLLRALKEPEKWLENFKTTAAGTVLKFTYGYTIEADKYDILVNSIDKTMSEFSLATVPMAWPVDLVPILRYLPEGFPGSSFKKTARQWRKSMLQSAYSPYRFVRRQMAAHDYRPSFVSRLVQEFKNGDESAVLGRRDEDAIVWTAVSLYAAGADTTAVTLSIFTLAMILFPDVQRKAQQEIDQVIGTDRLPNFEDRDNLPYINALVKESVRWWPIAPMGIPHTTDRELEYEGLIIPKGANIIPNVWWFLHDPDVYADPESFDPERFLSPRNEPDPNTEAFGYGRRICPGRFFADSSIYINIVQSLATFNLSKLGDKELSVKPTPGIVSYPTEFKLRVTPRSQKHVDLIQRVEVEHPWEVSHASLLGSETS